MRNRYENNFQATVQELAAYVLANAPRGITPRYAAELARTASGEEKVYDSKTIYVSFERAGRVASADLSIGLERLGDYSGIVNAEGRWYRYEVAVKINYPTHGSSTPSEVMTRLDLIRDAASFAMELDAAFNDRQIAHLVESAEEIAAAEASAEKARLMGKLAATSSGAVKGMRVGGEAIVPVAHSFPVGGHTFSIGEKSYVATVTSTEGFIVTRAS